MFLVRCPNCKHNMKCQPKGFNLAGKSKRCVYCGKSFKINDNMIKRL